MKRFSQQTFCLVLLLIHLLFSSGTEPARAYQVLDPGGGEIVVYPGLMDGDPLISAAARKSLSNCIDIGAWAIAIPDRDSRSELFFTSEFRYGLWYCCIPNYYLNYIYFSAGAGSYSRMGMGQRENAAALTYGSGVRIELYGNFIIGAELKGFSIFREEGREERVGWFIGCGFPL